MPFALNVPDSVSDWVSLELEALEYAKGLGEHGKRIRELAPLLRDVAVRVRVLPREKLLQQQDRLRALKDTDPDYYAKLDALDFDVMCAGLVEVRGVEPPGLQAEALWAALAATRLHTIIARVVAQHSSLSPTERAAFFSSAPAGTLTAPAAPTPESTS